MTAEFVFWAGVGWLAYVYAGYPALLALIGLAARVRSAPKDGFTPAVSVLISARNEERDIGWKIAQTLAWDYPADRLEVLVGSDASDDGTDAIVRSFRDRRVKLVRMERRGGKARALNRLAEHAAGDVLFFTDANSHIGPRALAQMTRHFADPSIGCVTGHTASLHAKESSNATISAASYWRMESLVRALESRIASVLVCDGAVFAIRRSLFHRLDPDLANDLELPLRIGGRGFGIVDEPAAQVLERDTSSSAEELSRRRRICAQGLLGAWRLRHTLHGVRAWQFLSHKLLRWFTAVPMAMTLAASAYLLDHPVFQMIFAGQLTMIAAAVTGLLLIRGGRPPGPFSTPLFVLLTSIGALAGMWDACIGRRFDVWESPALTRGCGLSGADRP